MEQQEFRQSQTDSKDWLKRHGNRIRVPMPLLYGGAKCRKKQKIGFLYILPALVLFFIFVAYPIIFNFYIGFHKWSGLGEPVWVGLKNYKKVFSEPVFKTVLKNFVIITGLFVILDSVFGMIIAAFLNLKLKMSKAARLLIYLPNILSSVVIGYAFQMLLETNNGIVNVWLRKLGLQNLAQQWLINPKLVIYVILALSFVAGCWFCYGFIHIRNFRNTPGII